MAFEEIKEAVDEFAQDATDTFKSWVRWQRENIWRRSPIPASRLLEKLWSPVLDEVTGPMDNQETPADTSGGRDTVQRNWERYGPPLPDPLPEAEVKDREPPKDVRPIARPPVISVPRRRLFSDEDLPGNSLEKPNWGQTATDTTPDKIWTLKESLARRDFGAILHEPISKEETLYRRKTPKAFQVEFDKRQDQNMRRLIRFSLEKELDIKALNEISRPHSSITQLGVVFLPLQDEIREKAQEKDQRLRLAIGLDDIAEIFNEYRRRSLPARQAVTGTIPLKIKYRDDSKFHKLKPTEVEFGLSTLDEIASVLGCDEFPVELPASLIRELDDEGNEEEQEPIEVRNFWQLADWFLASFDAIVGEWPQTITIEDADPLRSGNQAKKIVLPNLAETLAEVLQLSAQGYINTHSLLNVSTRTLIEAGLAKKEAIVAAHYAEANATYLNYKGKERAIDVPFSFRPPGPEDAPEMVERLDRFLRAGNSKVKVFQYADKTDLQTQIEDLRNAAAIIRAKFFYRLVGGGDYGEQIKNVIKRVADFTDGDGIPDAARPEGEAGATSGENDFDTFLNQAEMGFIDQPGMAESTRPYGRDIARRPKIRKVSGNQS